MLLLAVWLPPGTLETLGALVEEREAETPWGKVGPVARRRVAGTSDLWVLPYSGSPTRTDPRAPLWVARQWGIRRLIGWDTVVALNPSLRRGDNVILIDTVDATRQLPATILDDQDGSRQTAVPCLCADMQLLLNRMLPHSRPAVYLATDALRRETPAEARVYRGWGCDVIGQNLVPEAIFAWEMGLCFAGLGTVSELAADRTAVETRGEVREAIRQIIEMLPRFLATLSDDCKCECARRYKD